MDTTDAPGRLAAVFTAVIRSLRLLLLASTSTMLAARCDGMSPFDIQRLFHLPIAGRIRRCRRCTTRLTDHAEVRVGEAKLRVERFQVAADVGIVVGIDNYDGLAAPLPCTVEPLLVKLILLKP